MDVKPCYKQTDLGPIPLDWSVSTVGAEFSVQLGKMLDAERNVGVPKPYIGNRSVQWGHVDVSSLSYVPMTSSDLKRFRLQEGDILVCEGGEVGRAAIWDAPINECYFQKALHRLRPLNGYSTKLMIAVLKRWSDTGLFLNYVTQTSIAHLPRDKFLTVPIPVPTSQEIDAIASALSDVDGLLGVLDQLLSKKRDLKQAAMQQLLTGQTRLPGFTGEWKQTLLGAIGVFLKGSGVKKDEAHSGDLPCVRYGEIYTHHDDCVRAYNSKISKEVAMGAVPLQQGDLLFAGSGETKEEIGKCVAIIEDIEAYAGGDIVILRPAGTDPVFMGYYCNTPRVKRQKASKGQGDAVVHISAAALAAVEVDLPEIEEQHAIAKVLSSLDAELAALEQRRDKTRAIKQGMMQELLSGRTRLVNPDGSPKGQQPCSTTA